MRTDDNHISPVKGQSAELSEMCHGRRLLSCESARRLVGANLPEQHRSEIDRLRYFDLTD
jgi:hypothetical protein